ncbi:hypothetical protein [Salinarimonas ramus]|uniref:Prephenate dehydratase n=1 Tax=Salinarimonas ramus TaxID=690164 RepID=A0A917Q378_9HYPH|nr:hypothetical protein [Salinarimonas ramus]GGK18891.1 hypothetical protein GCM10011322_02030 [Salinarimonas ramus]
MLDHSRLTAIHTLGPTGTNCEAAAKHYAQAHGLDVQVVLHRTLEEGMVHVLQDPGAALLGCVVYPDLHGLVFPYLDRMTLADQFIFDTFPMVLAARSADAEIRLVGTHPAPRSLVPAQYEVRLVTSNAEAARLCAAGEVDACITTGVAARSHGLVVIEDNGPVPMGFTIHTHHAIARRAA